MNMDISNMEIWDINIFSIFLSIFFLFLFQTIDLIVCKKTAQLPYQMWNYNIYRLQISWFSCFTHLKQVFYLILTNCCFFFSFSSTDSIFFKIKLLFQSLKKCYLILPNLSLYIICKWRKINELRLNIYISCSNVNNIKIETVIFYDLNKINVVILAV